MSELVSHLEDYTGNKEERKIRECKLRLEKKISEKSQPIKQDVVKHKNDNTKATNNKDEQKGPNAVSNAREPFRSKFKEYSPLLCSYSEVKSIKSMRTMVITYGLVGTQGLGKTM